MLPSLPHGDPRADLEKQHRARILDAIMSIATVAGYAELSIASIMSLAQVRRRTFNGMFAGKEDAFLALYQQLVDELLAQLATAFDPDAAPSTQVRDCLGAVVAFLLADPVRAELVLLEVHAAGANAVGLQRAALDTLVDRTAAMLVEAEIDDAGRARLGAELAVGAVHDALRSHLYRGELDRLPDLVPDLAVAAFPMLAPDRPPVVGVAAGHAPSRPRGTTCTPSSRV